MKNILYNKVWVMLEMVQNVTTLNTGERDGDGDA